MYWGVLGRLVGLSSFVVGYVGLAGVYYDCGSSGYGDCFLCFLRWDCDGCER